MSELDVICDMSKKNLEEVPECIAKMSHLKMLYLDRNNITSLPEDIFQNLPNLSWLDLRDNKITEIPSGIANHKCLENMLLQNNKISKLPLEIATLPKLKVLQLSDNPVLYPPKEIVNRGIDDIMIFLQQEQYKQINARLSLNSETTSSQSSTIIQTAANRTQSGTLKLEILPTVIENNLNRRILNQRESYFENRCNRDKVHKVYSSPSKTTVHSYYRNMNVRDILPSQDKRTAEEIKQVWLEKLKELIMDQEKILQQERNINALKNWRNEKRLSTSKSSLKVAESKAPFDTNAIYNKYMTRSDPTSEINKAIVEQQPKFSKTEVNTVIEDVMAQLARAKDNMSEETNPEQRIRNAEHELQLIVNLHKKLERIQKSSFM